MSPKDSDSLSGARFTQAGVRRALKRKYYLCAVSKILDWVQKGGKSTTSSDLIWPDLTWSVYGYPPFISEISRIISVHLRSHSHWGWPPGFYSWTSKWTKQKGNNTRIRVTSTVTSDVIIIISNTASECTYFSQSTISKLQASSSQSSEPRLTSISSSASISNLASSSSSASVTQPLIVIQIL